MPVNDAGRSFVSFLKILLKIKYNKIKKSVLCNGGPIVKSECVCETCFSGIRTRGHWRNTQTRTPQRQLNKFN